MKKIVSYVIFLALLSAVIFTSCDNLVGLGSKVNTEKPVIKNAGDENQPGDFLSGDNNRIWLEVEQEYGVAEVFMEVEYLSKTTGKVERKTIDAYYDGNRKQWFVDIDTTDMEDGTIKTWVTAIDVDGNKSTTTDIIYFVKNLPPQIKLTMPSVGDDDFDNDIFLDNLKNEDPLYLGFELMGLATDDYGIAEGYPKIMIWPDNHTDVDADGLPVMLPDGTPLNGRYGTWRSLVVNNDKPGLTVKKFSWPMLNLTADSSAPGGYRLPQGSELRTNLSPLVKYRFRIMTKDLFGNVNYYPNRTDNKRGPGNEAMDPDDISRKFIEISYIAADIPIIQITDCPQYYNAAKDFKIDFLISSANPMHPTEPIYAYVKNETDETQQIVGGPYIPVPVSGSTSSPYRYTLTISAAEAKTWTNIPATGVLYVFLKAKDNQGKEGPDTYQVFNYDITPPEVPFDRPVVLSNVYATGKLNGGEYTILYPSGDAPKWVTGNVTVGGISKDNSGIKEVWYHIGKLGDDKITPAEREALYDNDLNWNNTNLHTSMPAAGWGGSVYAWTYTQFFPIGYKALNSGIVQELSDLSGYTGTNADTAGAGKERFYLPFYIKVVDAAGNRTIVHYKLCVDPLLDEPQVSIIYPDAGTTVGGTVRITGMAEDNFWMHTVLMRIHKDGDVDYTHPTDHTKDTAYWYKPPVNDPNDPWANYFFPHPVDGFDSIPPFTVPGNRAGWFKIKTVGDGPMVNWTCTVNGDGGLNPPSSGPETVDVYIEIIAIDTNEVTHQIPHITGPIERRTVKFSSKIPTIEEEQVTTNGVTRYYAEGTTTAAGKFTVSMKVSAIDGLHKVGVKVNSGVETPIILGSAAAPGLNTAIWNISPITLNGDRRESVITITVDSAAAGSLMPISYGNTGIMNMEVTVEDGTLNQFSTTKQYKIGIDNFYPSAVIETSIVASDNILAKGNKDNKYFNVQGTAQDWGPNSGQIQGLERVLVYFERATITYGVGAPAWTGRTVTGNGTYLTPSGGTANTSNTYFMDYSNVRDTAASGFNGNSQAPNAATFRVPRLDDSTGKWTSPLAMVIDNAENDPEEDYDGDGTYGEKWIGLTDKIWGARMMISDITGATQQFPDGPYMVHYLIMDQAGNATHYAKDIYVENNKPRITQINIGTDINFDNNVTEWTSSNAPGEYRENAYNVDLSSEAIGRIETPDSEFRIRNNRFGLRLTIEKGTGNKIATVTNVSRGAATSVANMERGKVYQIADTAASTDFTKYGAPNGYTNTVFVATGKGDGTGTVFPLNQVSTATQTFPQGIGTGTPITITSNNLYNQFPAAVTDTTEGLFLVKVYDSTVAGAHPEFDQLAHAVLLTVSINNTDSVAPKIDVADFGRRHLTSLMGVATNYDDNVLTNWADAVYTDYVDTTGNVKNGYVQYINDNIPASTTANISGKVIFNGKVTDNHRIDRIAVQIPGYNGGAEFNIAVRNTTTGNLQSATTNITGEREFRIVNPTVPQFTLAHSHTVVWQFMWDSSKITAVAQNNVSVTFKVYDMNTSVSDAKTVNIVPYISEVVTPLGGAYASNPSAFNRSALGGYPVKEGDSITIRGFNLGAAQASINGGALFGTNTAGTITGPVPAAATSGPLVVTVGGIASFNNSTAKNKNVSYNQEPNGVNNNTLDNSRYIYVWNTGYLNNTTPSQVYNPFFRMDNSGNRLLSFGYYPGAGAGRLRVHRNNTDYDTANANQNRMTNTTVATGGSNNSFYAAGSDITAGTTYNFYFGMSNAAGNGTGTASAITTVGSNSNRFKIPRIAVQPTAATRTDIAADRVLMSYFDGDSEEVRIIYGNAGATNAYAGTAATGGFAYAQSTVVASKDTPYKGSMYTAVGFLSNGLPLIAWYDNTSQNLLLSWGDGTPTTNSNNTVTSRVNTPTTSTGGSTTTNASATERVYTLAGHGLVVGAAVNNIANYDGFIVDNSTNTLLNNTRHFVRRVSGDDFVLNTANTATYGLNTLPANITFYPYNNVGRNANLANAGAPAVAGATVAVTWPNAAGGGVYLAVGNRVVVTVNNGNPNLLTVLTVTGAAGANGTVVFTQNGTTPYSLGANTVNSNTVRFFIPGKVPTSSRLDRYYTVPAGHGLYEGRSVTVNGSTYTVSELNGNNFKLRSSNAVADLGTGNITLTYAGGGWQSNAVIIDYSKGSHVDMAVDGANNIHLAYYDASNGGLWYALIPVSGTGAAARPNAAGVTPVKVDTYLSAGTKIMINVRQAGANWVPYITYAHASFKETRNSIRTAWRTNFTTGNTPLAGSNATDMFTGAWEVMTVPISNGVIPNIDEFVCNGVPTAATMPTMPPAAGGFTYNTNINQTIVVGYMTDMWYEGAVLKGDIRTVPAILQK